MTAGSCALFAGAVCLQSETSGGSGEAPALCFHGSFYISPGCTENDTVWDLAFFLQSTRNTLMWVKSTIENKMTSCCVSHKNTFGSCQKKKKKKGQLTGWEGFSSFIMSGSDFLLSPATSLAVRLAGRGSSIQEDSQHGWLILKALSCQEDLYSADTGNVFCQCLWNSNDVFHFVSHWRLWKFS